MMSVGLALVFVPLSSLSLLGVSQHDAGVASAVFNASQQIGGSLGTALLNTFYASAVANYLIGHHHSSVAKHKLVLLAYIHGYHRRARCRHRPARRRPGVVVFVFVNAEAGRDTDRCRSTIEDPRLHPEG